MLMALAAIGFYIYKKQPFKKQEKYKCSPLNPQFAEECIRKLKHLMEVEKAYLDADISLQSLAEKLSITSRLLSQILNETLDRNFSDFINFYRVEEAKKILQNPRSAQKKIIALAFDVGFNTKVAFYNAFKKFTNMTPAQYREKLRTGSK
jgi:AraC-like DNA-binding protein